MPEHDVLEAIAKLESKLERQDRLLKNIVDRHDNLVLKVQSRTNEDEKTDDSAPEDEVWHIDPLLYTPENVNMPPFQRDVLNRLHNLEMKERMTKKHVDRLENPDTDINPVVMARLENLEDALDKMLVAIEQRVGTLEEGFNELNEDKVDTDRRINFVQNIVTRNDANLNARLDNIANAFGNEVKRINIETDDTNDDIKDILTAMPMIKERIKNFCPDSNINDKDTYYDRLAGGLSNGNKDIADLLILSLRNMHEDDVKILMKSCHEAVCLPGNEEVFIME